MWRRLCCRVPRQIIHHAFIVWVVETSPGYGVVLQLRKFSDETSLGFTCRHLFPLVFTYFVLFRAIRSSVFGCSNTTRRCVVVLVVKARCESGWVFSGFGTRSAVFQPCANLPKPAAPAPLTPVAPEVSITILTESESGVRVTESNGLWRIRVTAEGKGGPEALPAVLRVGKWPT